MVWLGAISDLWDGSPCIHSIAKMPKGYYWISFESLTFGCLATPTGCGLAPRSGGLRGCSVFNSGHIPLDTPIPLISALVCCQLTAVGEKAFTLLCHGVMRVHTNAEPRLRFFMCLEAFFVSFIVLLVESSQHRVTYSLTTEYPKTGELLMNI